jgi:hypothetical protein
MATHERPTVLLVEDDRATREMFDYALRMDEFAVLLASDGLIALRVIEHELPDVIVRAACQRDRRSTGDDGPCGNECHPRHRCHGHRRENAGRRISDSTKADHSGCSVGCRSQSTRTAGRHAPDESCATTANVIDAGRIWKFHNNVQREDSFSLSKAWSQPFSSRTAVGGPLLIW